MGGVGGILTYVMASGRVKQANKAYSKVPITLLGPPKWRVKARQGAMGIARCVVVVVVVVNGTPPKWERKSKVKNRPPDLLFRLSG